MDKILRIGTRNSALALWQAEHVQRLLAQKGIKSILITIASSGDLNQETPLHQMGGIGVFTKALDDALLNNEIDCAVHSCKDLPTISHQNIVIAAYLEREDYRDVVVCKKDTQFYKNKEIATVATGSVRRKAQWLAAFPKHHIAALRGNVGTRLQKLETENWDAAIFAYAGIKRLQIFPQHYFFPEWMLPAPAQGVVVVTCTKENKKVFAALNSINDEQTALTTTVERDFLRLMEGGCIAPIGALATINKQKVYFDIAVHNADGSEKIQLHFEAELKKISNLSHFAFAEAEKKGAVKLIQSLQH